ncbi:MAG: VOC family protein [Terriglobales bacterium]
MAVKKLTPILFAEEIEPCLTFWIERLGFEKTIDVPDGNQLSFAILQKGPVELMYQTYASAEKDITTFSSEVRKGPSFLYVEVESLGETIGALKGVDVAMPVRTTFYGAKEIGVKDPAGHLVIFAQLGVAPED